jgi:hypothetical protein
MGEEAVFRVRKAYISEISRTNLRRRSRESLHGAGKGSLGKYSRYCREWRCRNASRVSISSKFKQRLTPPTALALTGLSPYELTGRAVC